MNTIRQVFRIACLLMVAILFAAATGVASPEALARLVKVDARIQPHSVTIEARSRESFEYSTNRVGANLFVVDLMGVSTDAATSAKIVDSAIVSSYRLVPYNEAQKSGVRLEVIVRTSIEPAIRRSAANSVEITFSDSPLSSDSSARSTVLPSVDSAIGSTRNSVISKVEIFPRSFGAEVQVESSGSLRYETVRLTGPDRLVIDLQSARLATRTNALRGAGSPVRSVRMSQFQPDVARVVIDLTSDAAYEVAVVGNRLVVSLKSQSPAASRITQSSRQPSAPLSSVTTNGFDSRIESLGLQRLSLPENLTQPSQVLAHPKFSDQPTNITPPEPKSAARAPEAARPSQAPSSSTGVKYTGEPISVNLKDVDLKDFFRLIHEISGLNIVVDPNVKGTLTIVLDEVPWDQALDLALMNNNLDKQLSGNVLRIATRETLKKEAEILRDLAKAQAEAIPQVVATRVLSYAKASTLQVTLKKFLSPRGEILADERSNMLIIRDIPDVLPEMDNLIRQMDRKSQQVEIEARVVAASRSFARDIGTQFGFAASATGGRNLFGGGSALPSSGFSRLGSGPIIPGNPGGILPPPPPIVFSDTGEIPLNTNLGASTPTSALSYFFSSPNFALDLVITAAESKGVGKLLSKPKVITQNNEKAVVKQGTKIPIQTTINNTISVQFIDAVLQLQVTPQITAEGTVFMQVLVENTQIDAGIPRVLGIPALNTQAAETSVLVEDGGTVVIGGVFISSQRTDISQVPLLGSIPLIGHLFKRTNINTSSQELLFFLTPRILPN